MMKKVFTQFSREERELSFSSSSTQIYFHHARLILMTMILVGLIGRERNFL
jgi:hypothetical protein